MEGGVMAGLFKRPRGWKTHTVRLFRQAICCHPFSSNLPAILPAVYPLPQRTCPYTMDSSLLGYSLPPEIRCGGGGIGYQKAADEAGREEMMVFSQQRGRRERTVGVDEAWCRARERTPSIEHILTCSSLLYLPSSFRSRSLFCLFCCLLFLLCRRKWFDMVASSSNFGGQRSRIFILR